MKSIVFCTSPLIIRAVLAQEGAYESLVYDNSPPIEEFYPDVKNKVWLLLQEGARTAGLIMLEPLNNVLWQPHIIIFEKYRGSGSENWGRLAAQYMKYTYRAQKLIALTPYLSAKHYAERMGFKYVGMLTQSIMKDGQLMDQYMLEHNLRGRIQ